MQTALQIRLANPGSLDAQRSEWLRERSVKWLKELDDTGGGDTLLEVGSYDGSFAERFGIWGWDVTCVDPDPVGEYPVFRGTLERFQNVYNCLLFSAVHLGEVLEHVERPDELLHRALEMLAHAGLVIVSVPTFMCPGHLRTYDMVELVRMLEDAGVDVMETCVHCKPGAEGRQISAWGVMQ